MIHVCTHPIECYLCDLNLLWLIYSLLMSSVLEILNSCCLFPYLSIKIRIPDLILWEIYTRENFGYLQNSLNLKFYSTTENRNLSGMSIFFFEKVINFISCESISSFNIFRFILPLDGRSSSVTGDYIQLLIMTAIDATSIFLYVIVLFTSIVV